MEIDAGSKKGKLITPYNTIHVYGTNLEPPVQTIMLLGRSEVRTTPMPYYGNLKPS